MPYLVWSNKPQSKKKKKKNAICLFKIKEQLSSEDWCVGTRLLCGC